MGTSNGLNQLNKYTGEFTRYLHDENDPSSISADFVSNIYEDSSQRLWIGTRRGGLNLFNRDSKTFKTIKNML